MSHTWFSVDVETSGLNPFDPDAHLLSIGAEALSLDGEPIGDFYVRIDRIDKLSPEWYDPELPSNSPTLTFWREQDPWVRAEAWEDTLLERHTPYAAAFYFSEWVNSFTDVWEEKVFVANPASFDFMWVCKLWAETGIPDPFHYHSLCLHSMKYGQKPTSWRTDRGHEAEMPHHPLSDAQAQSLDLKEMLCP